MKKLRPVYCIVVIFVMGVLCGILGTHFYYNCRMDSIICAKGQSREERLVKRLDRSLGLDARQREQVRGIVLETKEEIRKVRRQFRPQMQEIIGKAQVKINAILTPEQQKKYEKIISERKERERKRDY
jgi:hypothetical protein